MQQMRVLYYLPDAPDDAGHPQIVMKKLAAELGFTVIDAVAQSIGDAWWFWIEFDKKPDLPRWISEIPWAPVGSY